MFKEIKKNGPLLIQKAIVLVILLAILVGQCYAEDNNIDWVSLSYEEIVEIRNNANKLIAQMDADAKGLQPNMLYNDDKMSITFYDYYIKSYSSGSCYSDFGFMIENKTDEFLNLRIDGITINGTSFSFVHHVKIPAYSTYKDYFQDSDGEKFTKCGIDSVEKIDTLSLVFVYMSPSGQFHEEDYIQTNRISIETGSESEECNKSIDVNSIVDEILSYKNGNLKKMWDLIAQYGKQMSEKQLKECLLNYGKWAAVDKAGDEIKTYLKSPRSYYLYSGSVGSPELQDDGSYEVELNIRYGATNSYGAEETDEATVYVGFMIDTESVTVDFTDARLSSYDAFRYSH